MSPEVGVAAAAVAPDDRYKCSRFIRTYCALRGSHCENIDAVSAAIHAQKGTYRGSSAWCAEDINSYSVSSAGVVAWGWLIAWPHLSSGRER